MLRWGSLLFPHKFPLAFCPLHHHMAAHRLDDLFALEAPRNHSKTTVECFLNKIFAALEEPEIFQYHLNVQATEEKAHAVNRAIMDELENNADLRDLYEYRPGKLWTISRFVLMVRKGDRWHEVVFGCASVGQSIRGIMHNNLRPDSITLDDLYNEDDINNIESTLKKTNWFWSTLYPARAKHKRNRVAAIGTAANDEDLLKSLETKERWNHKRYAAVLDFDKKTVLWPELNTFDSLMADLEDMPSTIWYREMQNERRDDSESIVKNAWLKEWAFDPSDLRLNVGVNSDVVEEVLLGVDPSIGKKLTSDFTGIALVWKVTRHDESKSKYYIMGLWERRLSTDGRIKLIETIAEDQDPERPLSDVRIEAVAGFGDFPDEVIRRTSLPVTPVPHVPDKITNLENKSHYFERKRVFISRHISKDIRKKLEQQLTINKPRHDDVRDGLLLCLDDESGMWRHVS